MTRALAPDRARARRLRTTAGLTALVLLAAGLLGLLALLVPWLPGFSLLQSVLYVAAGAWGWNLARSTPGAQRFLIATGCGALVLWLLGVFVPGPGAENLLGLDGVDNLLHLGLGIALLLIGSGAFSSARDDEPTPNP
ncbi:DUF4383 domain-containing protein [Prauserella muralis]|uniref:Uncharacterized protein n=1 Tax=Prauserella muralis TaxID=588067 RepID=A0A2V4B0E1_9PSEU|nr:DUF4383 domain-containing protein [Prauserella muralis]PXY27721.1 hypothetical protein BAY60_15145 [Prauserella muralis]TWE22532.1 uncharacterized protein DUF4383 [Prauserella muralis]